MINLAGVQTVDTTILEELYLAGVSAEKINNVRDEVPYTYIGKLGNWTFERRWTYWSVTVDDTKDGLPLKQALELYNKKLPNKDGIIGQVIRSGGNAEGPSPNGYTARPIYDDNLDIKLEELGYKKEYSKILKKDYISITVGEIANLCNEGKLKIDRFVCTYHIDSQIGLTAFSRFITSLK